jgi:hypothetical protein
MVGVSDGPALAAAELGLAIGSTACGCARFGVSPGAWGPLTAGQSPPVRHGDVAGLK